jgi:hypothetical protein
VILSVCYNLDIDDNKCHYGIDGIKFYLRGLLMSPVVKILAKGRKTMLRVLGEEVAVGSKPEG